MADPDALAYFKQYLVNYGGGYLRNTLWSSPKTCTYCVGIPGNPSFPTCYPCGHTYAGNPETSDRRGFVSYGWDNHQSASTMYGYKEKAPPPETYRVVNTMLFYALHEHLTCAADPVHGLPTLWATVPSLRARGYPQALRTMTEKMLSWPEANMKAASSVIDPRTFRPENYVVTASVTGQHVLLIDDTWTSGAHAESAAAALKRAGASFITLLVLTRWLQPGRGDTTDFIKTELAADFDPDRCPFGPICP